MRWIIAASLVLMAAPVFALDLKGVQPGISKSKLDELFPTLDCVARSSPEQLSACDYRPAPTAKRDVSALNTLAGKPVREWKFEFRNDMLERVLVIMRSDDFADLVAALSVKHGAPAAATKSELQNAFGAKFDQHTIVWRSDGHKLYAFRFLGSRDTSALVLTSEEAEGRSRADAQRERHQRAKVL